MLGAAANNVALATAIAAAVAALASWASVLQASRWQRRQKEPWLYIQVTTIIGDPYKTTARIENAGGGFAQEAFFWVRENSHVCTGGVPPHGSLAAGQGVSLVTDLPANRKPEQFTEAVVICRSGSRIHAWDAAGRHKSWRLNRWAVLRRAGSKETIVHRFYPDAPLIRDLQVVPYQVTDTWQ